MPLATGVKLGVYEIQSLLGEGGMGQVYLARDTRLQRDVAIKVLPESLAGDPDRLMRFEREAQTLAALNHPNIAHIHGVEESAPAGSTATVRALVMEFVPGESLDARLARGTVPLDDALKIAQQLVEALDTAHSAGIVHRDLKPANIRVTPDGVVKVLDFGLARSGSAGSASSAGSVGSFANSPTITSPALTAAGIILGTAAYMSPEQAKGRVVDKRADIWAFGVVLYELLTGRRAFDGEDVSDLLVAVLSRDVDWSALPGATPRSIQQLLRRCLERDPKRRLRDIGDARVAIDDAIAGADQTPEGGAGGNAPSRNAAIGWTLIAAAAAAAAGWLGYTVAPPRDGPRAAQRLAIHLGANQELALGLDALYTFSPDGSTLVFSGMQDGRQSLMRRRLSDANAEPIPGTEGGRAPFFSPDGKWLGFVAGSRFLKVAVDGGRPFQMAEARGAGGAVWVDENTIVYAPMYSDGLFRMNADGGAPERLSTPDRAAGELGHWWPDLLPDRGHVIFSAFRTPVDRSRIGVLDLATREVRWVVEGGYFGRYVSSGHLLYTKGSRVYALPFDAKSVTATGPAVAVVDDVFTGHTGGFTSIAISSQGAVAYVTSSLGDPPRELLWLDRTGRATPVNTPRRRFLSVSLSPDDSRAALTILEESRDLWTLSFDRGTLSRLTSGQETEYDPRWSRDGRELFYVLDRPPFELHRIAAGGQTPGRPIWKEPAELDTQGIAVSPDGRTIAFNRTEEGTGENVYIRPIDGSEPPKAIRASRSDERNSSFSPDGRYLVYEDDDTGRLEIYVQSISDPSDRTQLSTDGGTQPLWARNGEIFFRHDDEMRVVTTRLTGRFTFDTPRKLFDLPFATGYRENDARVYDVSATGSRILIVSIPVEQRPRQIEVVIDWTTGLNRLAPAGPR